MGRFEAVSVTNFDGVLKSLGFGELREVINRASIADLFPAEKRCGIYVLHFANDECYVGQAVDVTRRYVQHRQTHGDIVRIAFKRVAKDCLGAEEQQLIWMLERRNFSLRNITFTSIPRGETDFDLVMSAEAQDAWLRGATDEDANDTRATHEELVGRYRDTFARFLRRADAEIAIGALQEYVRCGIPVPRRSEVAFWACSCLPSFKIPGVTILSRVNVNWQEVFTVAAEQGMLSFSFHLARSPLISRSGIYFRWLRHRYPGVLLSNDRYIPGGQDQMALYVKDAETFAALLQDERVRYAIRMFNLRLMRKGPCNFGRNHCLELADRLLT